SLPGILIVVSKVACVSVDLANPRSMFMSIVPLPDICTVMPDPPSEDAGAGKPVTCDVMVVVRCAMRSAPSGVIDTSVIRISPVAPSDPAPPGMGNEKFVGTVDV